MINGLNKNIFMKLKKLLLLLVLILGLTSCSNDTSEDNNSTEVVYADVKPNQSKYKAFYGQKLSKNLSVASRSSAVNPGGAESIKPVSVIFYPLTQTISFSNIFDNTTVEYKVTDVVVNGEVSVIYNFKIKEVSFSCTITNKTDSTAANAVITFAGGFYKFDITESDKKRIAKLVSKVTYTAKYVSDLNYTIKYTYADTLLVKLVRNYRNQNTLKDEVLVSDYTYDGGKLIKRTTKITDDPILYTTTYEYTNNLITKVIASAGDNKPSVRTYQYDEQGRLIFAKYASTLIMNYTYEKNKLTTTYTDSGNTYLETETSIYESDKKPFLISQDLILDPFLYLDIPESTLIDNDGISHKIYDYKFEYSPEGLFIKKMSMDGSDVLDTLVREYIEE